MIGASDTLGAVNCVQPVRWTHPRNRGLVFWWVGLPGQSGLPRLTNLCRFGQNDTSHATLIASPAWTPTPYGMGMTFNGSTQAAQAAGAVASGVVTFGCWVNLLAAGGFTYFAGTVTSSFKGLRSPSGTTVSLCDAAQDISYNPGAGWHRVVGALDGVNGTLFVDGVQRAQAASTVTGWDGVTLGARGSGLGPASFQNCVVTDAFLATRVWSAFDAIIDYDQARLSHPATLNRISNRSRAFAPAAAFDVATFPHPPQSLPDLRTWEAVSY